MKLKLDTYSSLVIMVIVNVFVTSVGLFIQNLNFIGVEQLLDYMNQSVIQTQESVENQQQFKVIGIAHEKTARQLENVTERATLAITSIDETQKNIAELTNDIFIMQKAQLENRKALGQFLAIIAASNNITIPDDLRKLLFLDGSEPELSAPPAF